jgi:thioesterase domain-containing protein
VNGGMPDDLCRALEQRWHLEIPISSAMGIEVVSFAEEELIVGAALTPNVNVHGSAFAGSQFSLASLCGWGQLHMQLARRGLDASIIFVDGRIECLKPVRADMVARCRLSEEAAAALDGLASEGRGRCQLSARIESGGELAATFTGTYGLKL